MEVPVVERGALAPGTLRQEAAEGGTRHGRLVAAPAKDEVERDVERPLDVVREAGPLTKGEAEEATPSGIGIGPDMAAEAHVAVQVAIGHRGVGEHGVDEGADPQADA